MTSDVLLREVTEDDLPIFFEQQLDPAANYMAAFTAKDPADREAFNAQSRYAAWPIVARDPNWQTESSPEINDPRRNFGG